MKKYYSPEAQERILTSDTEKIPSKVLAGATYNVGTDNRDTTLDSPGEIVPYRGPMTRSRTRNYRLTSRRCYFKEGVMPYFLNSSTNEWSRGRVAACGTAGLGFKTYRLLLASFLI
ncbi:hypothetical protein TNCT_72471 [Trichonephila clavata]|uniref:Uncharacterized protein n=1 Tax=Trichonephila clavata TaxID=2740835 RepID=A0A8X6LKQ8_TRICU|nr:hypothetical protein TNCT_72471 [Trichonephila clavata]